MKQTQAQKDNNITKLCHENSKGEYTTPSRMNPQSKMTRDKYYNIYHSYVSDHLTAKQVAEKFHMSPSSINGIIKWVVQQIGEVDPNAQLQQMLDKILLRQQKIDAEIDKVDLTTDEKLALWREQRANDLLESKISGLITTSPVIDNSDRRTLIVKKAEGFDRRGASG